MQLTSLPCRHHRVCVLCDGVPAHQPFFDLVGFESLQSLSLFLFPLTHWMLWWILPFLFPSYGLLLSLSPIFWKGMSFSLTLTYTFISFQRKRRLDKRKDTQREKERKGKAKLTAGDGSWWNGSGNDVMDDFCDGLWGRRRRWHKRGENLHNRWRRQIRVEQKTSPLYWVPRWPSLFHLNKDNTYDQENSGDGHGMAMEKREEMMKDRNSMTSGQEWNVFKREKREKKRWNLTPLTLGSDWKQCCPRQQ